MIRYAAVGYLGQDRPSREIVLLQGSGCKWKKCVFCDYHADVSADPFAVNREPLASVTGRYGVLDVINSGSCVELDGQTLDLIRRVSESKKIHTLWFEAHWMYRDRIAGFAGRFPGARVKFRTGAETFDPALRSRWQKGIPEWVSVKEMASYFAGVCLLVGLPGQTPEIVSRDIETAAEYFEYFSVNAFTENSTGIKPDRGLIGWFEKNLAPRLAGIGKAEVLLRNTDLGVG